MDPHKKFLFYFICFLTSLASISLLISGSILRTSIIPMDRISGAILYLFFTVYLPHPYFFYILHKINKTKLLAVLYLFSLLFSFAIFYFTIEIYNSRLE